MKKNKSGDSFNELIEKSIISNNNYLIIQKNLKEECFVIAKKRHVKITPSVSMNVFSPYERVEEKDYWIIFIVCKKLSNIKDKEVLKLIESGISVIEYIHGNNFLLDVISNF